ncbi:class II fructose-bisphosphatase [Methylobrevis pamukkalensis]|uniref:Fructose-1,6-bisphosphatase n=1 Tax=Methylobrevis pamukkalensis TaxID=1439726 RepID=A0A1E3H0Z3_9HYPH|nr:class II fructose-bisphosphatase [Methylobrevis pamukkalensis]ODN69805.1 Fructose-1,6-bisphosphatase class 2 [Methylobrevis pamukkalensis]
MAGKKKLPDLADLDRMLGLDIVRVTEAAAIAAARLRGRGDEQAADQAALAAMHAALAGLPFPGKVVVGEGDKGEAAHLFVGETIGHGKGMVFDIAADPLEGTTICAKNLPNSLSVIAVAGPDGLLHTPNIYMEKIAVGPGYPAGVVDLDAPARVNIAAVAKAKGVPAEEVTVCILDRPRHMRLIAEVRETGASIRLIGDGDVAGVIHTSDPEETGIDIYMGSGAAPAGVLAAAALRCTGGQMFGRLMVQNEDHLRLVKAAGIADPARIYAVEEMAKGEVLFAATGVTDGNFLSGVRFRGDRVRTHSILMSSATGTIRSIRSSHPDAAKGC